MSPIDIVPVDHQMYGDYIEETVMGSNGVIVNPAVISMSDVLSREESLSSVKPLISKGPPPRAAGRVVGACVNFDP